MKPQTQTPPPGFLLCSHANPIDPAHDGSSPCAADAPGARIFFLTSHPCPGDPLQEAEVDRSVLADGLAFALALPGGSTFPIGNPGEAPAAGRDPTGRPPA